MVLVRGATVALITSCVLLSSCAGNRPFGPTVGEVFSGMGSAQAAADAQTGIGVNAFLWRASLDTLSFMPLASADPYGGIIITDWFTNPEAPNERFKATVYILDTRLRADGLNVAIHRQTRSPGGDWVDAPPVTASAETIENQILVRARQIRISGR